jgi:hypothetical protein
LAIVFAVWGWVDVRLRGTVDPANPGIHKTDFTVYTEAGAAFFDGRDPYEVTNPRGWKYLYPPPFALVVAPLHALAPRAQVMVWFALCLLMAWGCYSECVRIARAVVPGESAGPVFGPIPNWIGWAAIGAALLPALNCLQRGQVGVLILYLLLLGFRLCVVSRSPARSYLAGGVLALPIVLKVTPLVPVGFLVCEQLVAGWHAPRRTAALARASALGAGVASGLVLCLLVVPAALVGWRANLDHLQRWHAVALDAEHSSSDDSAGDSSSPRNQSFTNAVGRLGNWAHYYFAGGPNDVDPTPRRREGQAFLMDAPLVGDLLLAARIAAGCLLAVVGFRVGRSRNQLATAAAFSLACASTLVLSPIARGHYYVLLLPATMFTGAWLLAQDRPRWAMGAAAAPAALSVAHYAAIDVAGRIGLLGIGTAVLYSLACAALVRSKRSPQLPAESILKLGPPASLEVRRRAA